MPIARPLPGQTLIAPSLLSANFARLGEDVEKVTAAGADWLHVDVMDGRFVPNITIGQPVVAALKKVARVPLDVHLMIIEPERYIDSFIDAGAEVVTVHVEASTHLHRTLQAIRARGVLAGVSLNPHTPPEAVEWVLDSCDLVLVMSVNPGFGGQSFIPSALRKMEWFANHASRNNLDYIIEVDGGVNTENIASISAAGASVCVAGNAVFSTPDWGATIELLKQRAAGGKVK